MSNVNIGENISELLRSRFEEVHQLDSEQSKFGQFGYIDQKINADWHTFRSGAINVLKIQRDLMEH